MLSVNSFDISKGSIKFNQSRDLPIKAIKISQDDYVVSSEAFIATKTDSDHDVPINSHDEASQHEPSMKVAFTDGPLNTSDHHLLSNENQDPQTEVFDSYGGKPMFDHSRLDSRLESKPDKHSQSAMQPKKDVHKNKLQLNDTNTSLGSLYQKIKSRKSIDLGQYKSVSKVNQRSGMIVQNQVIITPYKPICSNMMYRLKHHMIHARTHHVLNRLISCQKMSNGTETEIKNWKIS